MKDIESHTMYERIQSSLIKTTHVYSASQITNIFIKPFDNSLFHTLICKLRTLDIYVPAQSKLDLWIEYQKINQIIIVVISS